MSGHPDFRRLVRNAGYGLAAEGASRVTRIGATLALAWALTPAMFGAAALIMAAAEILRAPTRCGVLQFIVRAEEASLPSAVATAARVNWAVHLGLAAVQVALAWPLAQWMNAPDMAAPLAVLALIFLIYPVAFPRVAMLHRAERMGAVARLTGASLSAANILTALLALAGLGLWSVVLPRLGSALLWVVLARRAQPDLPAPAPAGDWRPVWRYGRSILGVEMLKVGRLNLDKVVVGKVLGMDALGLYAFAFNAGLGIGLAALKAFSDALFPFLCSSAREAGDLRRNAFRAMRLGLCVGALLFPLQAIAAHWYVPALFGAHWGGAVLPLTILCLSAIPRPVWEATSQILRAEGRPGVEVPFAITFAIASLVLVWLGAMAGGVTGAAAGVFAAHVFLEPLMARAALRRSDTGGLSCPVPASPSSFLSTMRHGRLMRRWTA